MPTRTCTVGVRAVLIRPAVAGDAGALARVTVDTWRHTYAGAVPADFLAGLSYERSAAGWETLLAREGTRVLVADDPEAGVVGYASAGRNTPAGEETPASSAFEANLYAIYVLPQHHLLGIGRALVTEMVRALLADGYRSMIVWVLKGNRACGFYERLGGKSVGQRKQTIGGLELEVVSYGWDDLPRLERALAERQQE